MREFSFDYKQYNAKINKSSRFGFTLIITAIIVLLGLAMFLMPKTNNKQEYYFVEADSFLSYNKASTLAAEIQQKNGAGFVYFDKKYHVLVSYYPSLQDAEKVCNNIIEDYPNATIYTKKVERINESGKTQLIHKDISKIINNNNNLINGLNSCINQYETKQDSLQKLTVNIQCLKDDYSSSFDAMNGLIKNNKNYTALNEYITNINDSCEILKDLKTENELSYKLRYHLINIIFNHCSFLSCL